MHDREAEKFAAWREHLERLYGKGTFVSRRWLRAQISKRVPVEHAVSVRNNSNETLEEIRADLGDCQRCGLSTTRKNIVFGEGNPRAKLVFIGEGPGEQEDEQGRPFVGPAGQLLDKIIEAMGYTRADVYIANVVKCRPPGNREPQASEAGACEPFLFRQLDALKPDVLVALGDTALKCLFGEDAELARMRGKFVEFRGRRLMPTFHPADLLRKPESKREVWEDMKLVKAELERLGGEKK